MKTKNNKLLRLLDKKIPSLADILLLRRCLEDMVRHENGENIREGLDNSTECQNAIDALEATKKYRIT